MHYVLKDLYSEDEYSKFLRSVGTCLPDWEPAETILIIFRNCSVYWPLLDIKTRSITLMKLRDILVRQSHSFVV
jgi:hypothetical protein